MPPDSECVSLARLEARENAVFTNAYAERQWVAPCDPGSLLRVSYLRG